MTERNDDTKEPQGIKEGWEHLRQHELELVQMLHKKAADEQDRAQRLESAGDHEGAEAARIQEREYLQEADDLVLDATDALRRQGDIDKAKD